MRQVFISLLYCVCLVAGAADSDTAYSEEEKGVNAALQFYLHGTSFNHQEEINQAFLSSARLYLPGKENTLREMTAEAYAKLFPEDKKNQFNGRIGRVLNIDVSGDMATAKAEILLLKPGIRFVDVFLLRKIQGAWRIISKTASSSNGPQHGRKLALIVSNAQQYPGTSVNTGNNFPELAYTYRSFTDAGYAIDFISPSGGAIPLEMISTADALQKQHLYDSDFMWALAHTRPAADAQAADYAAVVYIGGGAAIVDVPGNEALQALAMQVYNKPGGVIAAICQGTEGLTRLKQADGSFLISGKVLTSFPDAFLNKQSPIFKAYPFSVEGSIRQRNARFVHGANGSSHVQVDGRLVTGMNWESSVGVAQAVMRLLDR